MIFNNMFLSGTVITGDKYVILLMTCDKINTL